MKCIEVHCYYGPFAYPLADNTLDSILAEMAEAEIEKCVLMSTRSIAHDFMEGNAELAEAIAGHDNLYGLVYINMHYPEESAAEVRKYLGSDKFVGVKYNGEYCEAAACDDSNDEIFKLVDGEYGKPLLLHTWGGAEHGNTAAYSLPSQALKLAQKFPNMKIIMGHMGGTEWMSAIEAAKGADNLYLAVDDFLEHADKLFEFIICSRLEPFL